MAVPVKIFTEQSKSEIRDFMIKNEIINTQEELIHIEKLSGGNMNFVARIETESSSLIFKQSRPYVEKYPQVSAPIDRIAIEARFYQLMNSNEKLRSYVPNFLFSDFDNHILILENLDKSKDYSFLYKERLCLNQAELTTLIDFLNELHALEVYDFPDNMEMKILNHEHIFHYPFLLENGFDLDVVLQGLQSVSLKYKTDESFTNKILEIGKIYLHEKQNNILHGDFYPGSWLQLKNGQIKIIDHEFAFMGRKEFELGVFKAHLMITRHDDELIEKTMEYYKDMNQIDKALIDDFAGIEIMRRLIGLAQLPIVLTLDEREELLSRAYSMI